MAFELGALAIAEAIRDHMKTAPLNPVLCEVGDLAYWAESPSATGDLPAIFVRIESGELAPADMSVRLMSANHNIRILVVDHYSSDEKVVTTKLATVDAAAKHLMSGASTPRLGIGQITGLDSISGWLTGYDLEPAEDQQLALNGDRRLYAVELNGVVNASSARC